MISGALIWLGVLGGLFVIATIIVVVRLTSAGSKARQSLQIKDEKGIATFWEYAPLSFPTGIPFYVNDVEYKYIRHKWLNEPTEPGKGRIKFAYENKMVPGKELYIEVSDDKAIIPFVPTAKNQWVPQIRVLSDKDKTPMMSQLDAVRKDKDQFKKLYAKSLAQNRGLIATDTQRQVKQQQEKAKILASRHARTGQQRKDQDLENKDKQDQQTVQNQQAN